MTKMKVMRITGAATEIVEGVGVTKINEPFEAEESLANVLVNDGTGRFVKGTVVYGQEA